MQDFGKTKTKVSVGLCFTSFSSGDAGSLQGLAVEVAPVPWLAALTLCLQSPQCQAASFTCCNPAGSFCLPVPLVKILMVTLGLHR